MEVISNPVEYSTAVRSFLLEINLLERTTYRVAGRGARERRYEGRRSLGRRPENSGGERREPSQSPEGAAVAA